MKCLNCGRETFESRNAEAIEVDNGCLLVICNIPCYKCTECDDILYTGDVVEQIEQIIAAAKNLTQQLMVVDFTTAA